MRKLTIAHHAISDFIRTAFVGPRKESLRPHYVYRENMSARRSKLVVSHYNTKYYDRSGYHRLIFSHHAWDRTFVRNGSLEYIGERPVPGLGRTREMVIFSQ